MLHLAIICIVCAFSAPSEGIAFNGQKNNETIFYNVDEGEHNVAKVSFPSVYNDVQNSSDCAKPRLKIFYDYIIKQYENSKSNSCSSMERIPLEKNETLDSNAGFIYRKRKLLWNGSGFQPKTLRPPLQGSSGCFAKENLEKSEGESIAQKIKKLWISYTNWRKYGESTDKSVIRDAATNNFKSDLNRSDKKLFFCLQNLDSQNQKKALRSLNLDSLKVDEDLDLNKRIKKLVEELAQENHQKKEIFEEGLTTRRRDSNANDVKNENGLLPVINNSEKAFKFNNNYSNNIIDVENAAGDARGDVISEKAKNTISISDLETVPKVTRFVRNSQKSYSSYKSKRHDGPELKKTLIEQSNPHNPDIKANTFLRPQRSRKFFTRNTKKRWTRTKRSRSKKGLRDLQLHKNPQTTNGNSPDVSKIRSTSCEITQPGANVTGTEKIVSPNEQNVNLVLEDWKDLMEFFKKLNIQALKTAKKDSKEANENGETQTYFFPPFFFEKRLLEMIKNNENQINNAGTELSMNTMDLNSFDRSHSNHVNPFRYLKTRRISRDYITRKKDEDPKKLNLLYKRRKRNGSKNSSTDRKNGRSGPLSCVPYVRKGQEDQPKRIINVRENLMGRPIPQKSDIFEKTRLKPCRGERRYTSRNSFRDEDEAQSHPGFPFQYKTPLSTDRLSHEVPPEPCLVDPSASYEEDSSNSAYEASSGSAKTSDSETFQSTNPKTLPSRAPMCFPFKDGKSDIPANQCLPSEKGTLSESYYESAKFSPQEGLKADPPDFENCSSVEIPTFLPLHAGSSDTSNTEPLPTSTTAFEKTSSLTPTTDDSNSTDGFSIPKVPEHSTGSTADRTNHSSTVNSILQESESQGENESTSATRTTSKEEENTTMLSHFSGEHSKNSSREHPANEYRTDAKQFSNQKHQTQQTTGDQQHRKKEGKKQGTTDDHYFSVKQPKTEGKVHDQHSSDRKHQNKGQRKQEPIAEPRCSVQKHQKQDKIHDQHSSVQKHQNKGQRKQESTVDQHLLAPKHRKQDKIHDQHSSVQKHQNKGQRKQESTVDQHLLAPKHRKQDKIHDQHSSVQKHQNKGQKKQESTVDQYPSDQTHQCKGVKKQDPLEDQDFSNEENEKQKQSADQDSSDEVEEKQEQSENQDLLIEQYKKQEPSEDVISSADQNKKQEQNTNKDSSVDKEEKQEPPDDLLSTIKQNQKQGPIVQQESAVQQHKKPKKTHDQQYSVRPSQKKERKKQGITENQTSGVKNNPNASYKKERNSRKSAVHPPHHSNSKVVSFYRGPGSLASYKDSGMHNWKNFSRVAGLKKAEYRRELALNKKLLAKHQKVVRNQNVHPNKKRNSKQNYKADQRSGFWAKLFKGNCHQTLKKNNLRPQKTESNQNLGAKYPQQYNYNTKSLNYVPSYKSQKVEYSTFSTPLHDYTEYFPVYEHRTQAMENQSPTSRRRLKFENLLPFFRGLHRDKNPLTFIPEADELNVSPEEAKNYNAEFRMDSEEKFENVEEGSFQKRRKRGDDYYSVPENDYNDDIYDAAYSDESLRNQPSIKESSWTPPSYDMFRELAKAVTQVDRNEGIDKDSSKNSEFGKLISKNAVKNGKEHLHRVGSTVEKEIHPAGIHSTTAGSKTSIKASISKPSKNLIHPDQEKELENGEVIIGEVDHSPTTLKSASIVKGPKRTLTKPSPKVHSKVFPDLFYGDDGVKTTTNTTETVNIVKSTETGPFSPKADLRVQIFTVCEGYLEVVKLIKAQNQSLGEELDENLARFCEHVISQNFNFQSDKYKKSESVDSLTLGMITKDSEKASDSHGGSESTKDSASGYKSKAFSGRTLRETMASEKSRDLVPKRQLHGKIQNGHLILKHKSRGESKKRKKKSRLSRMRLSELRKRNRKKKEIEDDLLGKGITKERTELIRLLRKRKKALLSRLTKSKDSIKPDDLQGTEYFDEEDLVDPEAQISQYSGTVKPRRDEISSGTTKKNLSFPNVTLFPVYAKNYGYDSGGELIEVEVIWRQVNEKTHENKIFKNLSVLAMLLTSTNSPKILHEDSKVIKDGSENLSSTTSQTTEKLELLAAKVEAKHDNSTATVTTVESSTETTTATSESVTVTATNTSTPKNNTQIIISKPDPIYIVGAPTTANKTHPKISHKYGVAMDLFQEYSIEFLNYAVYILPIMFTILFLLCCLCCALQILKTQKSCKKRKKKKKKAASSRESSESSKSSTESEKRKREVKPKRTSGSEENFETAHKNNNKTFWNYLKAFSKVCREMDEENNQTEKKRSFLGFLKAKRDESKQEFFSSPTDETEALLNYPTGREKKHYSDHYLTCKARIIEEEKRDSEGQDEAAERRELLALLKELKKIGTENTEGKKEVKSVQVQYMAPEYDNTVFQPEYQITDFSYPYKRNVFGMPKGISPFYSKKFQFHPAIPPAAGDYSLYKEVNELTELLPWECYSQKNDFLKHCNIEIKQRDRCNRFLKIFRDSGMSCNVSTIEKNFRNNESEARSFIFNKYRSISKDRSDELVGVTPKISGTEVKLTENTPPYRLSYLKDRDLVEDLENSKSRSNKRKYVRLKDKGVLCRL